MCVPRPGRPSVGRPMSNDEVYAAGLLNRALDPATQPPEIRSYLRAEIELLDRTVVKGMAVIDFGCGTGRHLAMFGDRLRLGVGVDYEHTYVVEARRRVSVYAEASVLPRREWYRRLGHPVVEESNEFLMSEGGFRSEHFSEARLRSLVGDCVIYPLAGIAYLVKF